MTRIFAAISFALLGFNACGFEIGEVVIVVHDTDVEVEGKSVDKVWPGLDLQIEAMDADRLWVCSRHPGWLDGKHVVALSEATPILSEMIRQNPEKATLYSGRASTWRAHNEYEKSIADCNRAIQLDPQNAVSYVNRGVSFAMKGTPKKQCMISTRLFE